MKPKVGNPLDEQETIINIDPKQISDKASVYTTIPSMLSRMWKLYEQHPDEVELISDDKYGSEFKVPRDWVRIKPKRQMSEEQKQKMAERLAQYRAAGKKVEEEDIDDEDEEE